MSFRAFVFLLGGGAFVAGGIFMLLAGHGMARLILFAGLFLFLYLLVRLIYRIVARQAGAALKNPLTIAAQGFFDDLFDPMLSGLIRLLKEKHETSGRLAEVASRFEGVFDNMVEGVVVTASNSQILMVNPAFERILAIPASEAVGNRLGIVVRETAIHQLVEEVFRTRNRVMRELGYRSRGAAKVLNVVATISEPRDGSGKSYGIFLFYDMTTIRGLERIRKDFVANVSHEIRTPLTSIRGYAEALSDGALADPELAKSFLGIISTSADRLSRLVNDLLELSRLESGTVDLRLSPIEMGALADRLREEFFDRLSQKEMRLEADFSRPFTFISDDSLLHLVLVNLLDNAIKYSSPGSSVRLGAAMDDEGIQIDVEDRGMGIPEEELPRIFERFYRVDRSRSPAVPGTGLGLSIVRHVMTLLSGRVTVRSALGKGTTVSLHLPSRRLPSSSL
ncbi:MAG: ATP-binding protein [Nitrospirae bacterium]|nr:ATP-binding protein [Nitrospirota bacterium]